MNLRLSLFCGLALVASLPLAAQDPSPMPAAASSSPVQGGDNTFAGDVDLGAVIAGSFGVGEQDGVPNAGGPHYAARFPSAGPEFTALLGRGDGATPQVQFRFLDARVGDEVVAVGGDVAATVEGAVVSYARGIVRETYEARLDGIEQCFVLEQRPAVGGDFVVRGRIHTALPTTSDRDDGVRFTRDDGGGVSFGAVTGVDARGAQVRGTMRCRDDVMELSLPAWFVQTATYPLVLDPLIGAVLTIGDDPALDDLTPSIAYDATTGRFLVVWAVYYPGGGIGTAARLVRGQFVVPGGGIVGAQLHITDAAFDTSLPQVANVNQTDRFLVAWTGIDPTSAFPLFGVMARSVSAATGAMSNVVPVASWLVFTAVVGDRIGLGGDSRTGLLAGSRVLVAFQSADGSGTSIQASRVLVPASGDPVVDPGILIASSNNRLDDVAVSAHCGFGGRWLVTYGEGFSSPTGNMRKVVAQVVNTSGTACMGPQVVFDSGIVGNVATPAVATRDGNEFLVAWSDVAAGAIRLRRLVVGGACGSTTFAFDPVVSPLTQPGAAKSPALACVKSKYLLAFEQFQTGQRVFVRALDPTTCVACGLEQRVNSSTVVDGRPALASAWQGGDSTSEYALVAWSEFGAIKARNWTLHGTPTIVGLGGGCGISGFNDFATYNGLPQLGDSTFAVTMSNPTAPVIALVVGFSQVAVACGPCTLVAAPDLILPGVTPTAIPIPCRVDLIGADLYTQWLQWRPSGCSILPDIGTSNCLKFTISE